jgi:protoporphyrinogen oxidase
MTSRPIIVVGSGPSGLMQALYLARTKKRKVLVIEQQPTLGGMFASVMTPWGPVDQGVHILQETGDAAWDELFFEILPRDEWHVFEGVRKDLSGNIFEGRLDHGSIFPDLRRLPREDYLRCVGEMFAGLRSDPPGYADTPNLKAYFEARFGIHATHRVYRPLAEKLWRRPLDQLSPWAAKIVHLPRVVTHDASMTLALKASAPLDAVLGFPEQLNFPVERLSSSRRTLYPRRYGLGHLVAALGARLEALGVELLTSTRIDRLVAAHFAIEGRTPKRIEAEAMVWTTPLFDLSAHLGLEAPKLPDAPVPHRTIHLFLDHPPCTGDLYWLWSFDPADSLVRVSNPAAYCPQAAESGIWPLCVEMHVADAAVSDEQAIAQAEAELRLRGMIAPDTRVAGAYALRGGRGFVIPTIANCDALAAQRSDIAGRGIGNLVLSTQDISAGVFYLPEVLNASLGRLEQL